MGLLDGKVALISGAGRGQGRSHAVTLASEGADIIGFDICENTVESLEYSLSSEADLRETVALVEKFDRRMVSYKADVRDYDAVRAAVDAGVAELGRLDIVLANAGIMPIVGAPAKTNRAFYDAIDVMLTGVFNTVTAAEDHLLAGDTDGKCIVITSSTSGLKSLGTGDAGTAGYVAAKHGVVGLMRSWANKLGPVGIRVNTVHPTGVNSPMINNDAFARYVEDNQHAAADLRNILPVPLIECVDVSNTILFLCSDKARYVTGHTMVVDAGFTAR